MAAARREEAADVEVDMPMVEVAEDAAVVRHGSLVMVVVVVALRAAGEVLDMETGRRTFGEKMYICDRWEAHRRGTVWYRRVWPHLKHQERPVKPLCHHLSQPWDLKAQRWNQQLKAQSCQCTKIVLVQDFPSHRSRH